MNRAAWANRISMATGIISFLLGVYLVMTGRGYDDFFFPIFLGFTLAGSAYFNLQEKK